MKPWDPGEAIQETAHQKGGSPLTRGHLQTLSGQPPGNPHTAQPVSWAHHPALSSQVCWRRWLRDSKTDPEPRNGHKGYQTLQRMKGVGKRRWQRTHGNRCGMPHFPRPTPSQWTRLNSLIRMIPGHFFLSISYPFSLLKKDFEATWHSFTVCLLSVGCFTHTIYSPHKHTSHVIPI